MEKDTFKITAYPIFKGATRPPMIFGIPLTAAVLMSGSLMLIGMWFWMPLMFLILPIGWVMRIMAKEDDQVFHQLGLKVMLFTSMQSARKRWKGCYSFSPSLVKGKGKSDQTLFLIRPVSGVDTFGGDADRR